MADTCQLGTSSATAFSGPDMRFKASFDLWNDVVYYK